MTFKLTPALNNEMVQFGSQLNHLSYLEYQSEMIQKFYSEADIDMINQMTEWAQQPLMKLITIDKLKQMHIDVSTKRFKKQMADELTWVGEIDEFECVDEIDTVKAQIQEIREYSDTYLSGVSMGKYYRLRGEDAHTWPDFVMMTRLGMTMPNEHLSKYDEHAYFVDLLHSIWTANQSARMVKSLHTISDLQAEVDRLKQKNADLSYQVQLTAYSHQILQPGNHVYDYHEIKSRKQKLHWEFKRLSKLMKLGK